MGEAVIRIPHLETDVTRACQLSCIACNHHVPLWRVRPGGPPMADPERVLADLTALSRIVHADVWGALGGEPTLHPRLGDILQYARDSGVADRIELWTNGIRMAQMPDQVYWLCDEVVLSRYEGKLADEAVAFIQRRCDDNDTKLRIMDERLRPNFKTLFEPQPTGAAETKAKYDGCFFRHFSRVANDGYFYTCCCAPHMPVLVQGREAGADGVAIDGLTERALRAYLEKQEPLGACTICAGRDTAKDLQWFEESKPLEWLRKSGQDNSAGA